MFTGISGENTAATPATSLTVSRLVAAMRKEEFRNEKMYQATMSIARKMLKEGIVSEEEYRQIDTIFLEKYKPVFGTLSWVVSLVRKVRGILLRRREDKMLELIVLNRMREAQMHGELELDGGYKIRVDDLFDDN